MSVKYTHVNVCDIVLVSVHCTLFESMFFTFTMFNVLKKQNVIDRDTKSINKSVILSKECIHRTRVYETLRIEMKDNILYATKTLQSSEEIMSMFVDILERNISKSLN